MGEKIKIAIVVEAVLGGIRQHVYDIVCRLDKEKYDIYFLYSDRRADETFFEQKSELEKYAKLIPCNEMQREIGIQDLKAYKKIINVFKEIKPDIVHCHSSKAGIIGRLAAKHCGVKKILYTPHAYAFQSPDISIIKKKVYITAERYLSKHACNLTINVSKGELNLAAEYKIDRAEKFTLIYNGIPELMLPDKSKLRNRLGLDNSKYYIGFTGRCAKQKDPMTFLEIAKSVSKRKPNVEFIYVGNGDMQQIMKRWISNNEMESQIHMPGFRKDASEIVGALDLYLSTALYEGLPYSMIEAMRAGVPIIATDVTGNNELVFENINGMLFPAGDVAEGCRMIEKQIKEHCISEKAVKETFMESFSINTMMKKLNMVYEIGGGYNLISR